MSKKKSAMQKGFRKQTKEKPFLSKKEIYALIIIVAAVILGFVLFNYVYDDGFLSARQVEENDLVTYASTDNRGRYKKLAEVGQKEGYVRSTTATEDSPIGTFVFEPEEDSALESFTVGASFVNNESLTSSFVVFAEEAGVEIMEPIETTVNGRPAQLFAYEASWYSTEKDAAAGNEGEAEAPVDAEGAAEAVAESESMEVTEPADNTFEQHISAYINYNDTHTVILQANLTGEDDSFYMPHEECEAYLLQFADVIDMEFDAEK